MTGELRGVTEMAGLGRAADAPDSPESFREPPSGSRDVLSHFTDPGRKLTGHLTGKIIKFAKLYR